MGEATFGEQGIVLFDLTNLVWRSRSDTPTGIQRVELAYARYLLDHHGQQTRFLIAFPPKALVVPMAIAARFIAATEEAWNYSDQQEGVKKVQRLSRFLGANPCAKRQRAAAAQSGPGKNRFLLGANLMLRAMIQSMSPRNITSFGKSGRSITYICVSGSALPGPWISGWLQANPNISGVFMLHDLIPVTHPEYVRPVMAERHRRYVERLARSASAIVTNSQFTADSLSSFASSNGLRVPKTVVAPLGIDAGFSRPRAEDRMPPYFVFVGTIEPRKNHILLLQVWQRLVAKHGDAAPKLVIVGKRGWENENILDLLDRGEHLRSHMLECNSLSDQVMADLVANARALLLPSHVEGYGLPVAEALALGTPVICSDLPPLREIAGDIPEYVDPLAGRGWARLIMEYSDPNHPRRQAQLKRMKGYQAPTWTDHFKTVEEALNLSSQNPHVTARLTKRGRNIAPAPTVNAAPIAATSSGFGARTGSHRDRIDEF